MAESIILNSPEIIKSPSTGHRGVSYTAELEDYFRKVYPEYWNEQFSLTDGMYSYTKKVQYRSLYLAIGYKITRASMPSYSLGTTFGREGADNSITEDYEVGAQGSLRAGERITGKVVARRFMSAVHLSEDFLYKAQNSDTEFDVLADILKDTEDLQKHTLKRRIYLGSDGKISSVLKVVVGRNKDAAGTVTTLPATGGSAINALYTINDTDLHAGLIAGSGLPRNQVGSTGSGIGDALPVIAIQVENDAHLAEGEKYLLYSTAETDLVIETDPDSVPATEVELRGINVVLWQKDYTDPDEPICIFTVLPHESYLWTNGVKVTDELPAITQILIKGSVALYSCQMETGSDKRIGATIQKEYEGLRDLLFTQNNIVSAINRNVYKQFNCTITDLDNKIITAEALKKHINVMKRRNPDLVDFSVISASPEALTAVETSMLQLYQYVHDPASGKKVDIGFDSVSFYGNHMMPDDFAEHGKVYVVNNQELGEAIYRDWEWLTGAAEGVLGFLDRIDKTAIYEGFMIREANTYFEKFNVHSGFKNVQETMAGGRFSGLSAE